MGLLKKQASSHFRPIAAYLNYKFRSPPAPAAGDLISLMIIALASYREL